ncbi:hypothetical protein BJN45_03685 [Azonexus hydrophilus]|uniref:STAS domain-containing protein n=1 Tax=Azonexus hydrophilus TaxID=418702 RepID=A0A1R1ID90_9RHOO|nr:STAS domain-containing protein [Azonexus hydrophilus]OMG56721.1 hypothetical protein BJN45_03685 [Azonexus hydrophilus]
MIERSADRLNVSGAMVMDNARVLLGEGCAQMTKGDVVFDLSAVAEADSSAVAVMLGWLRHAVRIGAKVSFSGVPAGVLSLAELYGITALLPQA